MMNFENRQRGANSPLPHCGTTEPMEFVGFADNEGRIRPSLIAAAIAMGKMSAAGFNEGRIRPSLIAACRRRIFRWRWRGNEGRIRPSLIAA